MSFKVRTMGTRVGGFVIGMVMVAGAVAVAQEPPPYAGVEPAQGAEQAAPAAPVAAAAADPGAASVDYFHQQLSPYGQWVADERYGEVWVPQVAPGWRPYTTGHWANTDQGWAWVADEDWGWAPFHYGRWDVRGSERVGLDPGYGVGSGVGVVALWRAGMWGGRRCRRRWFWRSGARVRRGGDHAGLLYVRRRAGSAGSAGQRGDFARQPQRGVLPRAVEVSRYSLVGGRVVASGVAVDRIERAVGHAVPRVTVASLAAGGAHGRGAFYQPEVVSRAARVGAAEFGKRPPLAVAHPGATSVRSASHSVSAARTGARTGLLPGQHPAGAGGAHPGAPGAAMPGAAAAQAAQKAKEQAAKAAPPAKEKPPHR
jgi:hypothetical protein